MNTKEAVQQRKSFLNTEDIDTTHLSDSQLEIETIKHNIESYIGSVEIPVGLAGVLFTLLGIHLRSLNKGTIISGSA